jgi:hypothetical protein
MRELKEMISTQASLLRADSVAALGAISKLLPADTERRARLLATVYDVATADGVLPPDQIMRFDRVREAFGLADAGLGVLSDFTKSKVA